MATPQPLPGESQRAFARRADITVHRARQIIGESRGLTPQQARGHARRHGQKPLAPSPSGRRWLGDHRGAEVKSRRIGNGNHVVLVRNSDGYFDVDTYPSDWWDAMDAWFDQYDIDHEEYFG